MARLDGAGAGLLRNWLRDRSPPPRGPSSADRIPRAVLRLQLLLGMLVLGAPAKEDADMENNPPENLPHQVNGILGGSALFNLDLPSTKAVVRTDWSFRAGSGPEILIAEYKDGKLERRNTSDRFGQRLEAANETMLRIRALEKEDSSVLEARVFLASGEIHKQTFRLSVFEPIPDPQIRHHHLVSKTAEACNVTLQCLPSEKRGIDVSWRRGNRLAVLEEDSDWYRLSVESMTLHVSWRSDSLDLDSTFTCLLSNPVDQKNISFDLRSICQSKDDGHQKKMWSLIAPVVLCIILAAGFLGIRLWKKRPHPGAVPQTKPEKRGSPEVPYVELRKRSHPEGDENQDPDCLSPCLPETPMVVPPVTVYAELQPKQGGALPGFGPTNTCVPCHS